MKITIISFTIILLSIGTIYAQEKDLNTQENIREELLDLRTSINEIELRLSSSNKRLKQGIFVATLGYTVTILGGQLLGKEPEVGEALLYTGGAIGIGGTILLLDGFNKLKPRVRPAP